MSDYLNEEPYFILSCCYLPSSFRLLFRTSFLHFLCHLVNISSLMPFNFQGHPPLILTDINIVG